MPATLLLAASLTAAHIRAEMVTVESRLIELGYDKVKGAGEALPVPKVVVSDRLPRASLLSYGLHTIAVRPEPESCLIVRLDYEIANMEMIWAYRDATEEAAHKIADGYLPFSPNCMRLPIDGTLGALRSTLP